MAEHDSQRYHSFTCHLLKIYFNRKQFLSRVPIAKFNKIFFQVTVQYPGLIIAQ